jgi:hypothetical protein
MQLMSGTHFRQASKWLGHSTFTLTLNTYGDWIPEEDGGAANALPEPPKPLHRFPRQFRLRRRVSNLAAAATLATRRANSARFE